MADGTPEDHSSPAVVPVSSSFDGYARVISNLQGLMPSAGTIPQTFHLAWQVAAGYRNTKAADKQLRARLGPWYDTLITSALKKDPILQTGPFKEYLVTNHGALMADELSMGAANWTIFAHALGVAPITSAGKPHDRVVSTRSRQDHGDPYELELEGEAFCHIINFYARPKVTHSSQHANIGGIIQTDEFMSEERSDMERIWQAKWGTFGWEDKGPLTYVTFTPSSDSEILRRKEPFGKAGRYIMPNTRMMTYSQALYDIGTSAGELCWPKLQHRLVDQVKTLREFRQQVQEWTKHSRNARQHRTSTKPLGPDIDDFQGLLLNRSWLQHANRIVKNVFTDNSKDKDFRTDITNRVRELYSSREQDCLNMIADIDQKFQSLNIGFEFCPCNERPSSLEDNDSRQDCNTFEAVDATLASYKSADANSRRGQLYEARHEIISLFCYDPWLKFFYDAQSVWILHFGPEHKLWYQTVKLR